MKDSFINVVLKVPEEDFELVYSILMDYSFTGIEENYDEMIISFKSEDWNVEIKNNLIESFIRHNINFKFTEEKKLDDKNWNEEWEKNVKAIRVSERIGIAPAWKVNELDNEIKIIINPKMSFGTGEHSSTRLVSRLMDGIVEKDKFWIDAGTGTGVLAILASKLGAGKILAFDNNIWSLDNAKENIELNNETDNIELIQLDIQKDEIPEADGIVANLFLHLIVESFPLFYKSLVKTNGDLIVSGVLKFDSKDLISAAEKNGFVAVNQIIDEEWIGVHFKPKAISE